MLKRIYFRYIHDVLGKSWYTLSVGVIENEIISGQSNGLWFLLKAKTNDMTLNTEQENAVQKQFCTLGLCNIFKHVCIFLFVICVSSRDQ